MAVVIGNLALIVAIMMLKNLGFKGYFSLELIYLFYDYCWLYLQKPRRMAEAHIVHPHLHPARDWRAAERSWY